jgi:hypothetical protein
LPVEIAKNPGEGFLNSLHIINATVKESPHRFDMLEKEARKSKRRVCYHRTDRQTDRQIDMPNDFRHEDRLQCPSPVKRRSFLLMGEFREGELLHMLRVFDEEATQMNLELDFTSYGDEGTYLLSVSLSLSISLFARKGRLRSITSCNFTVADGERARIELSTLVRSLHCIDNQKLGKLVKKQEQKQGKAGKRREREREICQ